MQPGQLTGPAAVAKPGRAGSRLAQVSAQLIALAPLACAALYLLWIIAHFPRIIYDVHLDADASWAPALAGVSATGPGGGHILVGTASHFTTIWFLVLTRWVPFRNQLWDVAPFLMFLAGLGFVAWACRRIAGWWPALLTVAVGASGTAFVLLTVMSEGVHGATYFADSVLAAFLVFWATRSRHHPWPARIAVAAVIVLAGTTLASDTLFAASGLAPFLGAPLARWLLSRDHESLRMAQVTTGITAASAVLAVGVNRGMQALGFQKTFASSGYALASRRTAIANVGVFGRQLLGLGNGTFSHPPNPAVGAVHFVMALFLVGAVVVLFALLLHSARTKRPWSGETEAAPFLYLAYWTSSAVTVFAAFSLTAFAQGPSNLSRYVQPAFFALAATAPLWAARLGWRRTVVALGAALFCGLSVTGRQGLFIYEPLLRQTPQARHQRSEAIDFLKRHGVTNGYSGYWDSHPLTVQADMQVHFYPVITCRMPASSRLCPFFVNTRTNWYLPRPQTRTFLLFDASNPAGIASRPTPDLGPAAVTGRFGPLYVFIYDYDIASKLARPCPSRAENQFFCPSSPT
ncbi:MAG: hypothetical protein M3083_23335 [Actinomycetota bacterium]|nr:hypothetical protein [Actinomycetota bacterium]